MTIEHRSKTYACCLDIDGTVRQTAYPEGFRNMLRDVKTGRSLEPHEARAYFVIEKAKGREVVPMARECGNPCSMAHKGCTGFDYKGGGCAGYYTD